MNQDLPLGIIFQGEQNQCVVQLSEALEDIGLYRIPANKSDGILTKDLIEILNCYRSANRLPEAAYCDPVTLRSLGIECGGDDIMLLARYGQYASSSEVGCYDTCLEAAAEAARLGMTLCGYISTKCRIGSLGASVSDSAVSAALLACIGQ